jgi:uncharacterized protein YlxW (UPF0749 family)
MAEQTATIVTPARPPAPAGPTGGEAKETDEQKRVREQQERSTKEQSELQKAESDLVNHIVQSFESYTTKHGLTNVHRGELMRRVMDRLTKTTTTVAAASKVRGPGVVELPAEDGKPGVRTVDLHAYVAGEKPKSGEGQPTANSVPNPGEGGRK